VADAAWVSDSNNVPASGLFVDFSGNAGQGGATAFQYGIHHYRVNGQDHYANASDPYIPSALAPVVAGFRALNDSTPAAAPPTGSRLTLTGRSGKWAREKHGWLRT